MKLRKAWLVRLAALIASWIARVWLGTLRYRLYFPADRVDPHDPQLKERVIFAFWHESLLAPTGRKPLGTTCVLVSQHADGELIARIISHLGFRTVRGSTRRGAVEALRGLLRKGRRGHFGVTPDGPQGPRRKVQPGVVFLASKTGLPIAPFGIGFSSAWRTKSWDRFAIPKPWSTVYWVGGPLIHVPADLGKGDLKRYCRLVEQRLEEATAIAEAWAARQQATGNRQQRAA